MSRTSERGFALAGAVFGLVIIAVLVAGAFFVARQQLNVGRSSRTYAAAFEAAEAGLSHTVAGWSVTRYNDLVTGDSAQDSASLSNGARWRSSVMRLNSALFLIRVTGFDPTGSSERRLAALSRLQLVAVNVQAGLTTRSQLKLGGSSFLDGVDAPPSGWGGCPTSGLDTLPGVLTRDSTLISTSGCTNYTCIRGDPKIRQDTSVNDSTFFKFGDVDWNELVAMATIRFPGSFGPQQILPNGTATTCNYDDQFNWGEPGNPPPTFTVAGCRYYYPIIYVGLDAQLTTGRGQGILLVERDLKVTGGFEFYGPVIVRGSLQTSGQGGHFNGGVMAANVDLAQSSVLGDAVIRYSSCAVTTALRYNAPGRLLGQRSWGELTQ
jgi:hypothetical protein